MNKLMKICPIIFFIITAVVVTVAIVIPKWEDSQKKITIETTDEIKIFFAGWYNDKLYVSINDTWYQIGEGSYHKKSIKPVVEEIKNILDKYNLEYNFTYGTDLLEYYKPVLQLPNAVFSFGNEIQFEVSYYIYDSLQPGNEVFYIKQKVYENLKPKESLNNRGDGN
jgi:hypothetical protein